MDLEKLLKGKLRNGEIIIDTLHFIDESSIVEPHIQPSWRKEQSV
jgi:hypothetical protein